jgi:hypothetical protein
LDLNEHGPKDLLSGLKELANIAEEFIGQGKKKKLLITVNRLK